MIRVTHNGKAKTVTVLDTETPKEKQVYREAEVRIFYAERIVEIHSNGVLAAVLPLASTSAYFEDPVSK